MTETANMTVRHQPVFGSTMAYREIANAGAFRRSLFDYDVEKAAMAYSNTRT